MNDIRYLTNPVLQLVEEKSVEACLAIAEENGLQARIQWVPSTEPNTACFTVRIHPPLLEPFEHVAWRRTYLWGANYWQLPRELLGTRFTYRRQEYEFAGATLKSTVPGSYFVAIRRSDGWIMSCGLAFVKQSVLPAMIQAPRTGGMFSIGLGAKERIFVP